MPRLLPQLLKRLSNQPAVQTQSPPRPKTRKLPVKTRQEWPSFAATGRVASFLLDPINPITSPEEYDRTKLQPPRVRMTRREGNNLSEKSRRMTVRERSWWASPYLRMLGSPLRKCLLTSRVLPTDFLIRIAYMRIPSPRISQQCATAVFPDGLEHARFTSRKSGNGRYIVCWKKALNLLSERAINRRISPKPVIPLRLAEHIGHLLRVRVLQELAILSERLQSRPQSCVQTPVIRRLTRAEFSEVRRTARAPCENAIAILVVPPLNRDPQSKERAKPHFGSDNPPSSGQRARVYLPISELLLTGSAEHGERYDSNPDVKVPLYNGVSLFPSKEQRKALHERLSRLLMVERRSRYGKHGTRVSNDGGKFSRATSDGAESGKASHAFLLYSNEATALRGDAAALAIALWRIRMWEGGGWEEGSKPGGGWIQHIKLKSTS